MDMGVVVVSLVVVKGKNKPRNKLNTHQWGNKYQGNSKQSLKAMN